jgi:hypothetical protein
MLASSLTLVAAADAAFSCHAGMSDEMFQEYRCHSLMIPVVPSFQQHRYHSNYGLWESMPQIDFVARDPSSLLVALVSPSQVRHTLELSPKPNLQGAEPQTQLVTATVTVSAC